MSTLRQIFSTMLWVLFILFCAACLVVGLAAVMGPASRGAQSPTEASFRAACAAVNGNAVWNGRHWECLK